MTTTDEAPAVNGATPKLNAALARFQAELPKIAKGETAKVEGRDGKRGYEYDYAGLDAVSDAALPLLGKNGLAFTSWPTLIDGKFVLVYELLHDSGEQKSGIFPLVSSGRPQELGGLLTYYRRYALCAVTGIAPGGEDNDAQSANHTQQYDTPRSAAEAFENAAPAPRRANGNGQHATAAPEAGDDFTAAGQFNGYMVRAASFATEGDGRELWRAVTTSAKARDISREDAKQLQDIIQARIAQFRADAEKAVEGVVIAGLDPEDEWAAKVETIASPEDAEAAKADLAQQVKSGHMADARALAISAAIDLRVLALRRQDAEEAA